MTTIGILANAANSKFHYALFLDAAVRARAGEILLHRLLRAGDRSTRRPKTVAIVGADAEFSQNAIAGARPISRPCPSAPFSTGIPARRPISRRSCARCRRPSPTSSMPRPIRRIRSASCAPRTRSALGPSCSAALHRPHHHRGEDAIGAAINGIVNNDAFLPARA